MRRPIAARGRFTLLLTPACRTLARPPARTACARDGHTGRFRPRGRVGRLVLDPTADEGGGTGRRHQEREDAAPGNGTHSTESPVRRPPPGGNLLLDGWQQHRPVLRRHGRAQPAPRPRGECRTLSPLPDPKRHLSFVPQYHDGLKPHGIYPVDRIYLDQRYYDLGTKAGARWDFAVVRLAAREDGAEVEAVTGGFDLLPYPGYDHRKVRLIGYPGNSDTSHPKPLDCTSSTHRYTSTDPGAPGDFLEIACAGYIGGTSGGPFLVRDFTGYALIGVIGGYHTGGDFPDVSYSSYFTGDTLALYLHAVRGDTPAGPRQSPPSK